MIDREANIDLVFRNGLIDYEVLPPPEVWENIRPAVRMRQMPLMILRTAAMVAVIISLGFLAYRWSMNVSADLGNYSFAFNPASETRGFVSPDMNKLRQKAVPVNRKLKNDAIMPVLKEDNSISVTDDNELPGEVLSLGDNKGQEAKESTFNGKNDFIRLTKTQAPQLNYGDFSKTITSEIPAKNESNRWTIAALVSPTYYSGFNTGHNSLTSLLISEEQPVFSYSGGLALSYKINKRFSVQSGLYYSSLGNQLTGISSFSGFQKYDYTKGDHNFEVLTTSGTVYTSNSDIFLIDNVSSARIKTHYTSDVFDPTKADLQYLDNSLLQNFSYLEFPVVVKYKVIDRTFGFNIIGGLSSDFLLTNAVYSSLNGGKYLVAKTAGVNPITFTSSLGMGMEYSVSKNLSLNLEPTFRYYINPFSGITGLNMHPYSFGIFSGLSYRF